MVIEASDVVRILIFRSTHVHYYIHSSHLLYSLPNNISKGAGHLEFSSLENNLIIIILQITTDLRSNHNQTGI